MQEGGFKRIFLIVQIATVAVFLGRAWQHIYWEAPYRALFWDEKWMKPVVEGIFRVSWQDYVGNSDQAISTLIHTIGWFYVLCALAAILIKQLKKTSVIILWVGAISLFILAVLYSKEKFFHLGQLFEYTLQWSSPLFLIWLFQKNKMTNKMALAMKVATALAFVCHGLYAVGYYPRPGEFMEMTMIIMQVNDSQAISFLKTAGVLDFIVSVLLFLPDKFSRTALLYCIVWGFLTSLARVWAHFHVEFWSNSLLQWLYETVYRFPHFLIPLAIWLWQKTSNSQNLS